MFFNLFTVLHIFNDSIFCIIVVTIFSQCQQSFSPTKIRIPYLINSKESLNTILI